MRRSPTGDGSRQPAGEVVDPAVVGALERARVAAALRDLDAAVHAHVVEGRELTRLSPGDGDGLPRDAHREVVARARQLLDATRVEPVAHEEALHVEPVELRRRIGGPGACRASARGGEPRPHRRGSSGLPIAARRISFARGDTAPALRRSQHGDGGGARGAALQRRGRARSSTAGRAEKRRYSATSYTSLRRRRRRTRAPRWR